MSELTNRHTLPERRTYEVDLYRWARDQVSLLERGQLQAVDRRNLIEEMMAAARNEVRVLESHFEVLLLHLLKWWYQREKRDEYGGSWEASILNARGKIERLIRRSPSLKYELDETFRQAYSYARARAGAQMGWRQENWERNLPDKCPWTLEQVRSDFWSDD